MKLVNKLKYSLQLNLGVKFNTALSSQDKCYELQISLKEERKSMKRFW